MGFSCGVVGVLLWMVNVRAGESGQEGIKERREEGEEGRETNLIMNKISPGAPEEMPQTPISQHPLIPKPLHHLAMIITPLPFPLLHHPHKRALEILMTRHRTRARPLTPQIRNQWVKHRIMQHLNLIPHAIIPKHAPHDPRVEIHPHSHTAAQQI